MAGGSGSGYETKYIILYIDIVPDVPDTSGESKNNIGPPSGGPKMLSVHWSRSLSL